MQTVAKIDLDKHYTSSNVAKYCIDKTFEIIGEENISEIIEPSAGNGSFSSQLNCIAYDIKPEHESIIKQDYLTLDIKYKKGRLIIGNPPYGKSLNLAQKFYKKSVELGDYIAFILPISQLNNTRRMFDFDLVYSEDLGECDYSGVNLHCCFNIYKRPAEGLNKQKCVKLEDIKIVRHDSKGYNEITNYDIRMCYRGNGSAGKILKEGESYSSEYKIIVLNDSVREEVVRVLNEVDWSEELNKISMLSISQFRIHSLLKREIPNIN